MATQFLKKPSNAQMQDFALAWMQALEQQDFERAAAMLDQRGTHHISSNKLQQQCSRTVKQYGPASAVKLASKRQLFESMEFTSDDVAVEATEKPKAVGHLIFQLFVDGDIADETIELNLLRDVDGFTLAFRQMHVW
jgi:hypothetical protein